MRLYKVRQDAMSLHSTMRNFRCLLILLTIFSLSNARPGNEDAPELRVSYEGAQVINVETKEKDFLEQLAEKGDVQKWGGNTTHYDYFVPKGKVDEFKSILNEKKVQYDVKIEDVQSAIDQENPPVQDEDEFEGRRGHKMTWRSYHRLENIYGYLDYLAQTYPDLVSVGSVGNSVEGRPIKYIRISSGTPNAKKFWIDGGIHAREWITPATVTYIISELVENREKNLAYIKGIDFYIVPVVNPDGYEYTHQYQRLWRKNRGHKNNICPGVDLNRNWGYQYGGLGTSTEPCKEIYRGTGAFSEPETRAVSNFILNNKQNMEAFVTFHSYGQYILIPFGYGYNTLPHDYNDLLSAAQKMASAMRSAGGAAYTSGNSAQLLYPASGGADDWAKGAAQIKYAYTIELRDKGTFGFTLPANYIVPTAKEAFAAIKTLARTIQ